MSGRHTYTHSHAHTYTHTCISPILLLYTCSFPGTGHWGKSSLSTCGGWSAIRREGGARGKVNQWDHLLLSSNVPVCLSLLLLLLSLIKFLLEKKHNTSISAAPVPSFFVSECIESRDYRQVLTIIFSHPTRLSIKPFPYVLALLRKTFTGMVKNGSINSSCSQRWFCIAACRK